VEAVDFAAAVAATVAVVAVAIAAAAEKAPDAEIDARRETASRKQLIQYDNPLFSKESGFFVPGPNYSSPGLTVPTTSKSPVTT
jgi:hypothetical protein